MELRIYSFSCRDSESSYQRKSSDCVEEFHLMDAMYEGLTSKYTIAGFNQTYITHSGDMRSPALTRLGMCRMNNKKTRLAMG